MTISVFNADDHPILRKGIADLIGETADLHWIGSAADGRESLEKIRQLRPDVAILDVEMPHHTGLEVAKTLLAEGCSTRFILLTLHKSEALLHGALRAGIRGYLLKESSPDEIIAGIRAVACGRAYVNASLTHLLLAPSNPEPSILAKLSAHEVSILRLIARQKTTAEIADMLFISPKTVANHRNNISKKLELGGEQNGLLKWAMAQGDLLK